MNREKFRERDSGRECDGKRKAERGRKIKSEFGDIENGLRRRLGDAGRA